MAQTVKNLPAMQESQVRSLGQEDPLDENPGFPHSCISSFPLQHSCLENSTDRGDSWATVHGVTKNKDVGNKAREEKKSSEVRVLGKLTSGHPESIPGGIL